VPTGNQTHDHPNLIHTIESVFIYSSHPLIRLPLKKKLPDKKDRLLRRSI